MRIKTRIRQIRWIHRIRQIRRIHRVRPICRVHQVRRICQIRVLKIAFLNSPSKENKERYIS